MATKKRIVHLLAVFCLSVLTVALTARVSTAASAPVTVTNTASNPVPVSVQGTGSVTGSVTVTNSASNPVPVTGTVTTQNAGGGAATQVGQSASNIVYLVCTSQIDNGNCASVFIGGAFKVPNGEALVITDLQFFGSLTLGSTLPTGTYVGIGLGPNPFGVNASFLAPTDPTGGFYGQVHLSTGIVFGPGSTPFAQSSGASEMQMATQLQGYLVPNQ